MSDYNYAVFDMMAERPNQAAFLNFLHVGERAPDHQLEDLETG
jgi:hypothetical protein